MGSQAASLGGSGKTAHGKEDSTQGDRSRQTVATDISKQEAFSLLRNHRRRMVLNYLLETGETASVSEITEHVAAREYDTAASDVSPEQHKRVYTALYQLHLPRMDEYGVIEFDKDRGTIALGETASGVEEYLPRDTPSKSIRAEMVMVVVTVPLATLGVFGIGPFGAVPLLLWAGLTILALFGLGVIQWLK